MTHLCRMPFAFQVRFLKEGGPNDCKALLLSYFEIFLGCWEWLGTISLAVSLLVWLAWHQNSLVSDCIVGIQCHVAALPRQEQEDGQTNFCFKSSIPLILSVVSSFHLCSSHSSSISIYGAAICGVSGKDSQYTLQRLGNYVNSESFESFRRALSRSFVWEAISRQPAPMICLKLSNLSE